MSNSPESYRGYCPHCDEDTMITPSRFNADREVCFNCGRDVNKAVSPVTVNAAEIELMSFEMTPPVEDMAYDERIERELSEKETFVGQSRAAVSKRQRRRARQAELARAEREGRVNVR